MPEIASRNIGLALDMRGCPNRCRHCYLGCPPNGNLTEDDLRWAAAQFREYVKPGEGRPFIERLTVSSCYREPDFSDDYARLHELSNELSDGGADRYELLSVWRLARDGSYAEWAKRIGPDTCQITFFGLQQTNDWFYRRRGAFRDCLAATERLLDVGMKPRWQFFLTTKILPDLDGLMRLIDAMRLRERVQTLGGEFVAFIHPPDMSGEGANITHLAVTIDEARLVPDELLNASLPHLGRDSMWETEADIVSRAQSDPDSFGHPYGYPKPWLCFFVRGNWDVFPNMGTYTPMWKLGNLKTDSVAEIIGRFETDSSPALAMNRTVTVADLARRYGDPESRLVDIGFAELWFERYCAENCLTLSLAGSRAPGGAAS